VKNSTDVKTASEISNFLTAIHQKKKISENLIGKFNENSHSSNVSNDLEKYFLDQT
jgi:hypothetical protein